MIIYLLKVMLAMSLCLGLYHLFLAQMKNFVFNRFYLLSTLLFSLEAPFIRIPIFKKTNATEPQIFETLVSSIESNPIAQQATMNGISIHKLTLEGALMATAMIVTIILLIRFLKNFSIQIYKSWAREEGLVGGLRIVSSNVLSPYSFFNTLFIPRGMSSDEVPEEILHHECSHWRHLHSLDLLIIEFLIALHWFNPLLYLYRKALRENHEFTADHDVTHHLGDNKTYIETLLKYASPKNINSQLALSFNNSSTKKRIQMITLKPKSSNPFFFVSILFTAIICLAACSDLYEGADDFSPGESMALVDQKTDFKSLGSNPLKAHEQRKLFPRLIQKFSQSDVHYITYDDEKINNAELQKYVDLSFSFQVGVIVDGHPFFGGPYEYQVQLFSPERYERRKKEQAKWTKEWYKHAKVVNSEGDSVLIFDMMSPAAQKIILKNAKGEVGEMIIKTKNEYKFVEASTSY